MSFDIDKLAEQFKDAVFNPNSAPTVIQGIDHQIRFAAAQRASDGELTESQIAVREDLDPQDKIAQLFWANVSIAWSQVMTKAAASLVHW